MPSSHSGGPAALSQCLLGSWEMSQREKGSERPRATLTSQSRLAEEEDLKSGLADLSEKWPSSPGESCKIFWATPFTETGGKTRRSRKTQ